MNIQSTKRHRRGSALLVCTLAAVVLSMASIAIVRSGQRSIARVESLHTAEVGRHTAEGLFQRSIAGLRSNPNLVGTLVDSGAPVAEARVELTRHAADATQIRVFLYATSTVPAIDVTIDPTTL